MENQVLHLSDEGKSCRKIAAICNFYFSTVSRILKRNNKDISGRKGGRLRALSVRDCRNMARLLTSGKVNTPKQAARAVNKGVSEWTAIRSLQRIGLKAKEKKRKPALSLKNIGASQLMIGFCLESKLF